MLQSVLLLLLLFVGPSLVRTIPLHPMGHSIFWHFCNCRPPFVMFSCISCAFLNVLVFLHFYLFPLLMQSFMLPILRSTVNARTAGAAMVERPLNRRTIVRAAGVAAFSFADRATADTQHAAGCGCGDCAVHDAGCSCAACSLTHDSLVHEAGCACAACSKQALHESGCMCSECA